MSRRGVPHASFAQLFQARWQLTLCVRSRGRCLLNAQPDTDSRCPWKCWRVCAQEQGILQVSNPTWWSSRACFSNAALRTCTLQCPIVLCRRLAHVHLEAAHRKGLQSRACSTRPHLHVCVIVMASDFFCAGGWCMCTSKPRTENASTDWIVSTIQHGPCLPCEAHCQICFTVHSHPWPRDFC